MSDQSTEKSTQQQTGVLGSQKGMALLLAIFTVVLITYIVNEVSYETNVEYLVNSKSVQRVKAYYAAKSGIEISLLRIKIFNQVQQQLGGQNLGAMGKMVDMIWNMPFMWPPIVPPDMSSVDKDLINAKIKESTMDATYNTTIADEGSKIDINDLDSPSKSIRDATKKMLLQIFESKNTQDEAWAKAHRNFKAEELINNIIDWLDSNKEALNGGSENQLYSDNKELQDQSIQYPPNRFFRSVDELRLVAGMTEEIFQLLLPRITVYGAKAINPNSAPLDLIQSLDPTITAKTMAEFQKRRGDPQQPPFSSAQEFWDFLDQHEARISKETRETTPLVFTKASNFRIRSIGDFKGATRQIEVVVFDIDQTVNAVSTAYKKDNTPKTGDGKDSTQQKSSNPSSNQKDSKGPPRIVYWTEN